MDLIEQRREAGEKKNNISSSSTTTTSTNSGDSCSNNTSTSPVASLFSCPTATPLRRTLPSELDPDTRLLKFARLGHHHDPPSPHSPTLESQALNLSTGGFNSSLSFLSHSNNNSNHPSPTSNYQNSTTSTIQLFNGALPFSSSSSSSSSSSASNPKLYSFANLEDSKQYPLMLSSATSSPSAALFSAARTNHSSWPCFNPGPPASIFSPQQLLEFTQQTYVFKHFAAGVMPPTALLLPIINSVASLSRVVGAGSLHFGNNAGGVFGVGGLRVNGDPEPGRCRRTDGKKWRCAREVVPDQKYCERHMHRGRHRARAAKLNAVAASTNGTDPPMKPSSAPSQLALQSGSNNANASNGSTTNAMIKVSKEPQLHFSLQSGSADQANRSMRNFGGQPEEPPNLVVSAKLNFNHHLPTTSTQSKSQNVMMDMESLASQTAFPAFHSSSSQTGDRDAANLAALRHFGACDWPRITRIDQPPPLLSWFDHQGKSRTNCELSIASNPSPLPLSAAPDPAEAMVVGDYMGLSMAVGAKASSGTAKEEDRFGGMRNWVPIAWDNPAIGGPLGEVLQSNSTAINYSGGLANNGGDGCLNLIEESWDHEENASGSVKDSHSHSHHSPSLASPTGVLQVKASFGSYSDSSSSASSPRPALKLESANLGI